MSFIKKIMKLMKIEKSGWKMNYSELFDDCDPYYAPRNSFFLQGSVLLVLFILLFLIGCEAPTEVNEQPELIIPNSSSTKQIEFVGTTYIDGQVDELDFDSEGIYAKSLEVNKLDYENDVNIFSLPFVDHGEDYRYTFDYYIQKDIGKRVIFNEGELNSIDGAAVLTINKKNLLDFNIFGEDRSSLHVFKIKLLKDSDIIDERELKFNIIPTVSRTITIKIHQTEEFTTKDRGRKLKSITLSRVSGYNKKRDIHVGPNCGVVCETPHRDELTPKKCSNRGGMENIFHYTVYKSGGNYLQRVHFSNTINDCCRCDGLNAVLTIYSCMEVTQKLPPVIQKIKIDRLAAGDLVEFDLRSHSPKYGGKIINNRVEVEIPKDLRGFIHHDIDYASNTIQLFINR